MAETLTGEARGDAEATQIFATRIAAEADRLYTLVAGILDLGRPEAGVERTRRDPVDLWDVATRAVEHSLPQARERRISLSLREARRPPWPTPPGWSAAQQNPHNALKFTSAPGSVTVTVGAATGHPTMSVRDTGSGIPASQLPRIFDRFYTGDRSRSDRSSGLGLTIAKQTVELQGGEIKVLSIPGHGTLVRIVLPPRPCNPSYSAVIQVDYYRSVAASLALDFDADLAALRDGVRVLGRMVAEGVAVPCRGWR